MNARGASSLASMFVRLRRLQVMTVKELLQLLRDTVLILFVVYGFTGDVYLAGSGVNLQLRQAATVVHDADHSFASRELIHHFQPPYFRMDGEIEHPREGIRLLDQGSALIALDIPPRLQESLLRSESAAVQMQVDTTNSVIGFLAASYAEQIVARYGLAMGLKHLGLSEDSLKAIPSIQDDHHVWFNPNQNDAWFMSISELLNVITVFAILLPAAAMAREKERGTVEQLLVSPLTPFQIIFPKILAMTIMILVGTALSIFAILEPLFHVPIKGSLILFFTVTTLYVFTTAGLGLFAATIARNLAQVGMLTVLIVTPILFLSGTWTPPEAMPKWLLPVTMLSPLHYYMDVSYGIFLKGVGLGILWDSVLCIALIGIAVLGFGLWRFRRQFG